MLAPLPSCYHLCPHAIFVTASHLWEHCLTRGGWRGGKQVCVLFQGEGEVGQEGKPRAGAPGWWCPYLFVCAALPTVESDSCFGKDEVWSWRGEDCSRLQLVGTEGVPLAVNTSVGRLAACAFKVPAVNHLHIVSPARFILTSAWRGQPGAPLPVPWRAESFKSCLGWFCRGEIRFTWPRSTSGRFCKCGTLLALDPAGESSVGWAEPQEPAGDREERLVCIGHRGRLGRATL